MGGRLIQTVSVLGNLRTLAVKIYEIPTEEHTVSDNFIYKVILKLNNIIKWLTGKK